MCELSLCQKDSFASDSDKVILSKMEKLNMGVESMIGFKLVAGCSGEAKNLHPDSGYETQLTCCKKKVLVDVIDRAEDNNSVFHTVLTY